MKTWSERMKREIAEIYPTWYACPLCHESHSDFGTRAEVIEHLISKHNDDDDAYWVVQNGVKK